MCWKAPKPTPPPPPPPLPAAAGPPPAAPKPTRTAELLRPSGTNAAVRQARTKKAKDPSLRGTGALRIKLQDPQNTGASTPQGGVNK